MNLTQNIRKSNKIVKVNTFLSILALNHLVASITSQKYQFLPKKASFCQWPKWDLMTFTQKSRKNNKIVKVIPFLALSAFRHLVAPSPTQKWSFFVGKCKFFLGGQNELSSGTLSQKSGKITKLRQSEQIFANFSIQASSCTHCYPKIVSFCRKLQIFEVDQKELTSMTRSQNVWKIGKIHSSEHIFGNFSFQATSCIHSYPKIINFCRKVQNFVCDQNELTLMNL